MDLSAANFFSGMVFGCQGMRTKILDWLYCLQIKSICQLECCLQRFGVEKCLVIGFSEMAFLHWKQVLRVQFQHRIWLSWFFLRFFCLQKGQRIRFIFSSGFAARATSISTTICQKKNREEDLNKGEYRYLKCTRPCGFFFFIPSSYQFVYHCFN